MLNTFNLPASKYNLLENKQSDIIIIGGGLAGLTSAIHLCKAGLAVTLIEKNAYPQHKVCGEYISNEVLPYLQHLDADPLSIGAKKINRFLLSTTRGKTIETRLPLGGFGISRYAFDLFLYRKALASGCVVRTETVADVQFVNNRFTVTTREGNQTKAPLVIGAYGKRSNLDIKLERDFIRNKSPFVAVKTHMQGNFPEDLVALHNFKGGYCGVSQVENGNLNVCFLANYKSFREYKNIDLFIESVLFRNPHLKRVFEDSTPVFDQPLTISQVSFSDKSTIEDHILMCGDAAGMIHPLCGNGMAMAIHSAKILSEQIIDYFQPGNGSRANLEQSYTKAWHSEFRKRIATGRVLQGFFGKDNLARVIMYGLTHVPGVLPAIIRQTHGKPLKPVGL